MTAIMLNTWLLFFFSFLFFAPAAFLAPPSQGLVLFAGNLGSPSQLPGLNEPKGIQPLPSRRQPLMKGLSPHFPASGGVANLTHFSISLMCSSHDIGPELTSFIFTSPLTSASPLLLANLPLPWLDTLVDPALRNHQAGSGIQFFIPKYMPALPSSVCVSVCACLQKLQERRK